MEQIKIGRTSFNSDYLSTVDLETAIARFKHIDARIVTRAHEIANPKKKSSAKRKRKRKDD